MKKIFALIFTVLINIISFAQQHIVEFYISNKEEIKNLPSYISVDNYKDQKVTAYLWADNFDKFKTLGYKFTEINYQSDIKSIDMATSISQMANWNKYPNYDVYLQMMQDFAINYPNICQIDTIGTTQNGRLLLVAVISDNPNSTEAEPDFFYTSTMHGDETTGAILMLHLIDSLLRSYGTATDITNLINNVRIFINPFANPDGTYHGGNSTVANAVRYYADGHDPNRDFPDPEHLNSPYSLETQEMMNFASTHNFVVSVNFHGGAEVYNFPWDYWYSYQNMHADDAWFRHFGTNYISSARVLNSSYMTGVEASGVVEGADWYTADGSRQDYMMYYQHCKEVTIELSNTKLLSSSLLPTYWNYNKYALINYIGSSIEGFHGLVTNSNGEPINAKIEILGFDKDNSWTVTNPITGAYFRPIQPGTYTVTYSADGYRTQTKNIFIPNWNSSIIQDLVLLQENEINIKGIIINAQSGKIIENTEIDFWGNQNYGYFSNSNGEFSGIIKDGIYNIHFFKTGYHPLIQTKDFSNDTTIDFALISSTAYSFEHEIPIDFSLLGNADWTRDNTITKDSLFSLKSGTIADNQSTTIQLTTNTEAGKIFFFKKVSSEENSDSLCFYIDGIKQTGWSGEIDWTLEGFDVSAGNHTFTWTYKKDATGSSVNDCAWIDYIDLPINIPNSYTVSFSVENFENSNPIEDANIYLIGYGKKNTDILGNADFDNIYETINPDSIKYIVSKLGFLNDTGYLQISGPINENIKLHINPDINEEIKDIFKIYPNPAKNFITIETDKNTGTIFIYDLNGKSVLSEKINSNNSILDISNLKKGIYIVKFVENLRTQVAKIIKD